MKTWTITIIAACTISFMTPGCRDEKPGQQSGDARGLLKLDDSNFEEVVEKGVVLVDFWAVHCIPCRVQGPIVEKVADQFWDKATFAKYDVVLGPARAADLGIYALPALALFKDGKPVKVFQGLTQADSLVAAVTAALEPAAVSVE